MVDFRQGFREKGTAEHSTLRVSKGEREGGRGASVE